MNERVAPDVVEARRKWVEALESGEREQTVGQLRNGDAFCCLGVACDVLDLGRWKDNVYVVPDDVNGISSMPGTVRDAYGLGCLAALMCRNDGEGPPPPNDPAASRQWTFPEIAALLRSEDWFGEHLDRVVAS